MHLHVMISRNMHIYAWLREAMFQLKSLSVSALFQLKSKAGDGHFACARGERRHPGRRRSPASPEVIRRNGGLVLSRTHLVLTSPASPAVFSMTG